MEWFPWFSAYYRSKTLHLTLNEDALYRRLIDYYMENRSPLPDNDQALARICAVDLECFTHASSILREFFTPKKGLLFHDFCDNQLDIQDVKSKKRSDISKKAANSRWKKNEQNQNDECIEHASMHATDDASMHATGQDITGQEKDTAVIRARVELSKSIGKIMGWDKNPNWFGDFSRIESWLNAGWNPELDILPTVKKLKAGKADIKTLKYFEQAIADAHASRLSPTPKGNIHGKSSNKQSAQSIAEQTQRVMDRIRKGETFENPFSALSGPESIREGGEY